MKPCCTRARRLILLLFGGTLVSFASAFTAESPFLYGIHDANPDPSEFLNHVSSGTGGTGGWVTATVAVGANTNDFSGANFTTLSNAGHTVICRINYGYYPETETNWTTLGSDTVAGGGVLSMTNSTSAGPQRFYRILQLD